MDSSPLIRSSPQHTIPEIVLGASASAVSSACAVSSASSSPAVSSFFLLFFVSLLSASSVFSSSEDAFSNCAACSLLLHNLRFRSAGYLQVLSDVWFLPALYYSSSQELYREPHQDNTDKTQQNICLFPFSLLISAHFSQFSFTVNYGYDIHI